jgi:hypothetical protein
MNFKKTSPLHQKKRLRNSGVRWALHGKGGVRHAATNWVKQYDASTMCRPFESTAVRLATNRQGASLDNAIETR